MAEVLAEGYNVFDTSKSPSGTVKYLSSPADVINLIQSGKPQEHILLVRGGTTTFLAPALSMGAIGVITMSGAPESGLLALEVIQPDDYIEESNEILTFMQRILWGKRQDGGVQLADPPRRPSPRRPRP